MGPWSELWLESLAPLPGTPPQGSEGLRMSSCFKEGLSSSLPEKISGLMSDFCSLLGLYWKSSGPAGAIIFWKISLEGSGSLGRLHG